MGSCGRPRLALPRLLGQRRRCRPAWRRAGGANHLVRCVISSSRRALVPRSPGEQLDSGAAGIRIRVFVSEGRALVCCICRPVCVCCVDLDVSYVLLLGHPGYNT